MEIGRRTFIQAVTAIAAALPSRVSLADSSWPASSFSASESELPPFVLAGNNHVVDIVIDENDHTVVKIAANLLADDVMRVARLRPRVVTGSSNAPRVVIAGTLGKSALIDKLAASGKLVGIDKVRDKWEATLTQVVDNPSPGVRQAFVIAGSDRRATAYGLTQISESIGVSPWVWWADVPVQQRDQVAIQRVAPRVDAPGVKYRGIFINDEGWGFAPWAKKNFDKEFGNAGPKTYARVFELMLRLRLNYIWPAMWKTVEFGSVPANPKVADDYAIVMSSAHCEQMLYNNIHWDPDTQGSWNYTTNRKMIHGVWEQTATQRGGYEAVWTLGIRGIHDEPMRDPAHGSGDKSAVLEQIIKDQRAILDADVTRRWGPVAQQFIPYKEVLPIYDAGLKVPDDVTLVWVDDNYGYVRRLSSAAERKRAGGSGIYYHVSYYGEPHSYDWIYTTAPAFMWEELHKAWQNDVRTIWVVNVGNIKPAEIGIDFLARLAWSPDSFGPDSQPKFLRAFAAKNIGEKYADAISELLMEFYRLGTVRKPELMNREWMMAMPADEARQLEADYRKLLDMNDRLIAAIPQQARDAYVEMIGFPAQLIAAAGLLFAADRKVQEGTNALANELEMKRWHDFIGARAEDYNRNLANGKWNFIMPRCPRDDQPEGPGPYDQLRWPWTEKNSVWTGQVEWPYSHKLTEPSEDCYACAELAPSPLRVNRPPESQTWRNAITFDEKTGSENAQWTPVLGLGRSNAAMMLQPQTVDVPWASKPSSAPSLMYGFQLEKPASADAFVDFLPTFRLVPGMKLRVAVQVDDGQVQLVEVPGSDGSEDELGSIRKFAVSDNLVRLRISLPALSAGKHTFKIQAVDPGVLIDRISLP